MGQGHAGVIKDPVAIGQVRHIDEQQLAVLDHHVLGVDIAVNKGLAVGDAVDDVMQDGHLFRGVVDPHIIHPLVVQLLGAAEDAGVGLGAVERSDDLTVFHRVLVQRFGMCAEPVGEGIRVDQLVHHAVAAAALDHVIGDRRGDAEHESLLGVGDLPLDLIEGFLLSENLHDGIAVQTVNRSVAALADDLAALHGNFAEGLFDLQNAGEAGHIENLVHLQRGVDDDGVVHSLFQPQHDPQAHTGDIGQLPGVQDHFGRLVLVHKTKDLRFYLGRVGGIHPLGQFDYQKPIFKKMFHLFLLHSYLLSRYFSLSRDSFSSETPSWSRRYASTEPYSRFTASKAASRYSPFTPTMACASPTSDSS